MLTFSPVILSACVVSCILQGKELSFPSWWLKVITDPINKLTSSLSVGVIKNKINGTNCLRPQIVIHLNNALKTTGFLWIKKFKNSLQGAYYVPGKCIPIIFFMISCFLNEKFNIECDINTLFLSFLSWSRTKKEINNVYFHSTNEFNTVYLWTTHDYRDSC